MNQHKYLFLLGGSNFEKITIKRLLTDLGHQISDLNLLWGAKLSNFKSRYIALQIFVNNQINSIALPSYLIIIDHHKPSSHKIPHMSKKLNFSGLFLSEGQISNTN